MENQHRKIVGYRELSAEEIALMNEVKEEGQRIAALIEKVQVHFNKQVEDAYGDDFDEVANQHELDRLIAANPQLWIDRATEDAQIAIMALVRAVAQPTTF
jgi:hypothetical protein